MPSTRRVALALVLMALVASVAWRAYRIDRPFVGRHGSVSAYVAIWAVNFARHGLAATRGLMIENGEPTLGSYRAYFFTWSPLNPIAISRLLLVLPREEWVFRAYSLVFMTATLPLVYAIGRRVEERTGVLAMLLLALAPLHVYYSTLVCRDATLLPFSLGAIACALQANVSARQAAWRWGAVSCYAVSAALGWNGLTLAPLLALYWLPRWRQTWLAILALIGWGALVTAAIVAHPFLAGVEGAAEVWRLKLGMNAVGGSASLLASLRDYGNYLNDAVPPPVYVLALLGAVWLVVRRRAMPGSTWGAIWLTGGYALIWPILMHGSARQHDFQLLGSLPVVAILAGYGLSRLCAVAAWVWPRAGAWAALATAGALLTVCLVPAIPRWRMMLTQPSDRSHLLHAAGVVANRNSSPNDWVFCVWPVGFVTYYADRTLRGVDWPTQDYEGFLERMRQELVWHASTPGAGDIVFCIHKRNVLRPLVQVLVREFPAWADGDFILVRMDHWPPYAGPPGE